MKNMYKLRREGTYLRFYRVGYHTITGYAVDSKTYFRIDLYWFIRIPFILLLAALVAFSVIKRYDSCMEIFNNFWYCALR